MQRLVKQRMASGLPLKFVPKFTCDECHLGKIIQSPYPLAQHLPVSEKLGLVHTDICGPVPVSKDGYRYFATITDDATRYKWVFLLKTKNEIIAKIKEWIPYAQRRSEKKLICIRSDHGAEFTSGALESFLKEKGIEHQFSITYHPAQNGVAERLNRILVEKTRTMLLTAKLPASYWSYAIQHATWLLNRTPSMALKENITPFEAWIGRKPNLKGIHVFGCMAIGFIPKLLRDTKFSLPGRWLCFLGMSENHKGWRLIDPKTSELTVVRSARFRDDLTLHAWKIQEKLQPEELDAQTFEVLAETEDVPDDDLSNPNPPNPSLEKTILADDSQPLHEHDDIVDDDPIVRRSSRLSEQMQSSQQGGTSSSSQTSTMDDIPSSKYYQDLLRDQSVFLTVTQDEASSHELNLYSTNLHALVAQASTSLPPEPTSAKEALSGPYAEDWKKAMDAEMETLTERGTWELVELPAHHRPVGVKWVFKIKTNADGSLEKFKARLVAKGFSQVYLTDYRETFAPVSDYTTARLLLAIAAVKRYALVQLDIKNAFLYGDMDTIVYMKQPDGYNDGTDRVCKLVKSLYGLKQSPRMWYQRLSSALVKMGFTKSIHDEALFISDAPVWCLIYVDDILMTSPVKGEIDKYVELLKKEFTLTIMTTVSQYLGMNLSHNLETGEITISCEKYLEKMVKKYDVKMTGRRVRTPLNPVSLSSEGEPDQMTQLEYQGRVGSLLFSSTCCRLDISFPVHFVAQGNLKRSSSLVHSLHRIIRYVIQTKHLGLKYGGTHADLTLRGYTDASFGANVKGEDQRSSYGWLYTLGGCAVSWTTKRHATTSLSTAAAELMSAKETITQALHLRALLHDLGTPQVLPTEVSIDSQAAYQASIGENFSKRLKHVNVALQWVREQLRDNHVKLVLIKSIHQPAYFLIKALPIAPFENCRSLVGLKGVTKGKEVMSEDEDDKEDLKTF